MMATRKLVVWAAVLATAIGGIVTIILIHKRRPVVLRGAVIRQDTDPSKQVPIANAQVTADTDGVTQQTQSDQAGLFTITLPYRFRRRQSITLRLEHRDYQPLELDEILGDQLYVARMLPEPVPAKGHASNRQEQIISHVLVRYVVRATDIADVGSAVKTFQVANNGNVPCKTPHQCSPDGKWEAASESVSLDAGQGNEFRNVRVSCIAGPCPFTGIEQETVSADGRRLNVVARVWSDTATFLVEAEVVRRTEGAIVREAYPAIFGPALSFSLPASAEGPSIIADVNGEAIVFPLGPNLLLSWAQCTEAKSTEQTTLYRCELRPGYRFQ
jgi:hypothetical protein